MVVSSPNSSGETLSVRAATIGTARIVICVPRTLIDCPVHSFGKSALRSRLRDACPRLAGTNPSSALGQRSLSPARAPDAAARRIGRLCDPAPMPENQSAAEQRAAVEAIVRRARGLTPTERRRLGRWTSASLRDPRIAPRLEAARTRAIEALDREPDRKKRWESASRPLHEALVQATADARRGRFLMLGCHLAALLAIVNVPGGLPPLIALAITLTAPLSAWSRGAAELAGWGRSTRLSPPRSATGWSPTTSIRSDRPGRTRSRPTRRLRHRPLARSTRSVRARCSSSPYSWSLRRLLPDDAHPLDDRPVPAAGRGRPLGAHVRRATRWASSVTGSSPGHSAPARSSTPTTRPSSCPSSCSTSSSRPGWRRRSSRSSCSLAHARRRRPRETFASTILTLRGRGRWAWPRACSSSSRR